MTKEAADGQLAFRDEGMIVGPSIVYPTEQNILETVNEIDRLNAALT